MRPGLEMLLLGLATSASTATGGFAALSLTRHGPLIAGFSQGAVLGVVLLDLLPDALKAATPGQPMGLVLLYAAVGLVAAGAADRALTNALGQGSAHRGHAGAASLTLHSLMDGLAIGVALQVSPALGALVAFAVIAHDFADGINTVSFSLGGGLTACGARLWLAADALAPLVGIGLAQALQVPGSVFSPVLAILAGVLLYVGVFRAALAATDRRPRPLSLLAACTGFGLIFGVSRIF